MYGAGELAGADEALGSAFAELASKLCGPAIGWLRWSHGNFASREVRRRQPHLHAGFRPSDCLASLGPPSTDRQSGDVPGDSEFVSRPELCLSLHPRLVANGLQEHYVHYAGRNTTQSVPACSRASPRGSAARRQAAGTDDAVGVHRGVSAGQRHRQPARGDLLPEYAQY